MRESLARPVRIGTVEFGNNLALSPMEGVTHLPFRIICRRHGAGLVFTEMAVGMALVHGARKERELLSTCAGERPVIMQVMAKDEAVLAESARVLERAGAAVIDLNLGCPSRAVVNHGGGAALLRDVGRVAALVRTLVRATRLPVTVKVRAGWDRVTRNAPEVARAAEAEGAQAVFVHCRTREDRFAPQVDWTVIGETVAAVRVPVFGNGGVRDGAGAVRMMRETGCAGVMIGIAATGNPWIFDEVLAALRGDPPPPPPSARARMETFLEHARGLVALKGERTGVREMRKFAAGYARGMPGAAEFRQSCHRADTLADLEKGVRA